MVLHREQLLHDAAVPTVSHLMENIYAYADSAEGYTNVWDWSDQAGLKESRKALWDYLLSLIPASVRNRARIAGHFAVRRPTHDR